MLSWLARRKELDEQIVECYLQGEYLKDKIALLEKRKDALYFDKSVMDLHTARQAIDMQIVELYLQMSDIQQQITNLERIKQLEVKQYTTYSK